MADKDLTLMQNVFDKKFTKANVTLSDMLKNKTIDYIFGMITGASLMLAFWACTTPLDASGQPTSTAGGVNITFTGNVMSQDFIENEAIPQIRDAIRRGASLGVS